MSSSITFRGQLLVTFHRAHGYLAGVPWIGNARRRPACSLRIGHGEVKTKRWDGVGEATWRETFRFVVDCDGGETATFVSRTADTALPCHQSLLSSSSAPLTPSPVLSPRVRS